LDAEAGLPVTAAPAGCWAHASATWAVPMSPCPPRCATDLDALSRPALSICPRTPRVAGGSVCVEWDFSVSPLSRNSTLSGRHGTARHGPDDRRPHEQGRAALSLGGPCHEAPVLRVRGDPDALARVPLRLRHREGAGPGQPRGEPDLRWKRRCYARRFLRDDGRRHHVSEQFRDRQLGSLQPHLRRSDARSAGVVGPVEVALRAEVWADEPDPHRPIAVVV